MPTQSHPAALPDWFTYHNISCPVSVSLCPTGVSLRLRRWESVSFPARFKVFWWDCTTFLPEPEITESLPHGLLSSHSVITLSLPCKWLLITFPTPSRTSPHPQDDKLEAQTLFFKSAHILLCSRRHICVSRPRITGCNRTRASLNKSQPLKNDGFPQRHSGPNY